MTATTIRSEEIMTDFQFKAILDMVIDLAEATKDVDKVIEKLKAIREGGSRKDKKEDSE